MRKGNVIKMTQGNKKPKKEIPLWIDLFSVFACAALVAALFYWIAVFINWQLWPEDVGAQKIAANYLRGIFAGSVIMFLIMMGISRGNRK